MRTSVVMLGMLAGDARRRALISRRPAALPGSRLPPAAGFR